MPKAADAARPLAGWRVLVTRPAHQADALCAGLEALGALPLRFPVIAIAGPRDPAAARVALARMAGADLVIFISANAVERGLELQPLPDGARVAAVGQATARALADRSARTILVPRTTYDSEGLLALPELQAVAGQRILIVRGEGGRETLAETLRARGADVAYAEAYRRVPPTGLDPARTLGEPWQATLVTSGEGLRALFELAGHAARPRLIATPLVVASARMVELASRLGVRAPVVVADDATDAALIEALVRLASPADPRMTP